MLIYLFFVTFITVFVWIEPTPCSFRIMSTLIDKKCNSLSLYANEKKNENYSLCIIAILIVCILRKMPGFLLENNEFSFILG